MSGRKRATVSINDEDIRRLHSTQLKAETASATPLTFHSESMAAMWDIHSAQQARQANFEESICAFDGRLRQMESLSNQRFLQQEAQMLQRLEQVSGNIWNKTNELVENHQHSFQTALAELRQQQNILAEILQDQYDDQTNNGAHKEALASQALSACWQVFEFTQENYPHEYYLPHTLVGLSQELERASQNLEQGMPEAAFLSAQQLYTCLSETRLRLEEMQSEHEFLRQAAWDAAWQLHEFAGNKRNVQGIDMDGKEIDIDIDVDYWSARKLSRLQMTLQRILERIEVESDILAPAACRELLENTLPQIQADLETTILQARLAALSSQLRINIADVAIQALESQGFELVEAIYPRGDMRQAYQARLCSLEGSEVTVQVSPLPGEVCRNDLRLDSNDSQPRSEHELRQRAREVSRALQRFGLQVGEMAALPQGAAEMAGEHHRSERVLMER